MDNLAVKRLKAQMKVALKKQKKFHFSVPDETGAEISYMASKPNLCWPGLLGGLYFRFQMESCGVTEKSSLPKNAKNYYRIVRKNGTILRIDSYVHGACDGILLMHYEGNTRYAFPFLHTGKVSHNYIQVQCRNDFGEVIEEYMVRPNQMIHHSYFKRMDQSVQHFHIFLTKKGIRSNLEIREGSFTFNWQLRYTETPIPDCTNRNVEI